MAKKRKTKKQKKAGTQKRKYKIVNVGRFDQELKPYAFDDGETVSQVLSKAGITLTAGESVNSIDGDALELSDKVKANDSLIIVANFKSGI